ncbi:rod shape-determining protein MreC [Candidatus Shapirobacteria bacterium]|nr:rod shape-determining protein MreC [Candidatus Shapirobacteria bacterium]
MGKQTRIFLILLASSLFLILLDHFGFLGPVKSFSQGLFLPAQKAIYQSWQRVRGSVGRDREVSELNKKVQEQEREIANCKLLIANCMVQVGEQRKLLGAPLPSEWEFLQAQTAGLLGDSLTLDKGKKDGVYVGQAVISENVLAGKVFWVGERIAKARLITSKESKILAKVVSAAREGIGIKARGVLVGDGQNMKLHEVLQSENLSEGDLVATAEDPANLLLGKIKKVEKKEAELYQEAEVEPFLDPKTLEIVFLIK